MLSYFKDHEFLSLLVTFSVITFVGSIIIIPYIISKLPTDYFCDEKRHPSKLRRYHPVIYLLIRILKNIIGIILIIAGIIMFITPGQGIITLLIGLSLTEFPGKYKLERRIIRNQKVYKTLNWIRKKTGAPPLEYPD